MRARRRPSLTGRGWETPPLATNTLWVQQAIYKKLIERIKIPCRQNPSDALTKHLPEGPRDEHFRTCAVVSKDSRAMIAPHTRADKLQTYKQDGKEQIGDARNVAEQKRMQEKQTPEACGVLLLLYAVAPWEGRLRIEMPCVRYGGCGGGRNQAEESNGKQRR